MLSLPGLVAAGTLDFDITILFQFVIFSLAIAIMHFLIIKPYLQVREAREEGTQGKREDATETEERAMQQKAKYEEQLSEARRDAMGVRESLRNQGLAEKEEMVEEVRREVAAKLTEERGALNKRVSELEEQIDERAEALAKMMIDKVLPEDLEAAN